MAKKSHKREDATDAVDELISFANDLKNETDRAAVILGAVKLDQSLYQILHKVLKPSTARSDELLDGDNPLSTFSARIILCHRLGFIDDELCRALNLIRKIRNSFAHELSGISLSSGAHRDRIRELIAPLRDNGDFRWLVDEIFSDCPGAAAEFRAAVALAAARLYDIFENQSALYVRNPVPFLTPGLRADGEKQKLADS